MAMSSTTMNCTRHSSARASHLRRSVAAGVACISEVMVSTLERVASNLQVNSFDPALDAMMSNVSKRYEQYCPMAHALDLVGDRWALLVIRELMHGPKRYTDLVDRL